jgi:hypothetical protein
MLKNMKKLNAGKKTGFSVLPCDWQAVFCTHKAQSTEDYEPFVLGLANNQAQYFKTVFIASFIC